MTDDRENRPIALVSEHEGHVEIELPGDSTTIILGDEQAKKLGMKLLRITTDESGND